MPAVSPPDRSPFEVIHGLEQEISRKEALFNQQRKIKVSEEDSLTLADFMMTK